MSTRIVKLPYDHWLRATNAREKERQRKARDRYRWPSSHNDNRHSSDRHDRRFVIWDGEGPHDTGYSLFGNSDGDEICHPHLGTVEILDFLLAHREENRRVVNLWFGMEYDVSMIFNDLPKRQARALVAGNRTVWGDYEFWHIPHKWLTIKRGRISITLYDYQSFFQTGLVDAVKSWGIGSPEEIDALQKDKDRRDEFLWADIENIKLYFHLELGLMLDLANELRKILEHDDFVPSSWHGPGALASMALRRNNVYDAMCPTPVYMQDAVRCAFAGGHFELFLAGHFRRPLWNYDINSAYPYYATFLPNLAKGTWRKGCGYEPGKFAVYHIEYKNEDDNGVLGKFPLFFRAATGEVSWPYMVDGWYWSPEAELVAGDNHAKFIEAWVFDEDDPTDRPFAFINDYYHRRQAYKRAGSAVEKAYKLIINAIYGQLARRVGWNKKDGTAPKSHQLEWAGYITSACRAAVYRAGRSAGEELVSIDTDGLYSLCPIDGLDLGDGLGQWEVTEYEDGAFQQSGVYALKTTKGWEKAKTRGIPRGRYDPEELVRCAGSQETMTHYKSVFVGYRQALMGRWEERNQWVKVDVDYVFGGDGKRHHNSRLCVKRCSNGIHRLAMNTITIFGWDNYDKMTKRFAREFVPESQPHYLPWLHNPDEMRYNKETWALFSEDDPDMEGIAEWLQLTTWQEKSETPFTRPDTKLRIKSALATVAGASTQMRKRLVSLSSSRTDDGT